jgi:predicted amino acid-binding ACT domain protein
VPQAKAVLRRSVSAAVVGSRQTCSNGIISGFSAWMVKNQVGIKNINFFVSFDLFSKIIFRFFASTMISDYSFGFIDI